LLLGGRAPEYLRNNAKLLDITRDFAQGGKWLFAICHGIQVLIAARVISGKFVTCYEHVRTEVTQAGATYRTEQAVRDGRLVTGQTWQSHPEFYREVFACLKSDFEPVNAGSEPMYSR
jgi:protease I